MRERRGADEIQDVLDAGPLAAGDCQDAAAQVRDPNRVVVHVQAPSRARFVVEYMLTPSNTTSAPGGLSIRGQPLA